MQRIAIFVHPAFPFNSSYYLYEIARVWQERGMEIAVLCDPSKHIDADLAVLHVDLTEVPTEFISAMRRYPASINGFVADISKRMVSENLVANPEEYEGPVIVKSNLNSGGKPEAYLASMGHRSRNFHRAVSEYAIYESPRDVPEPVWSDRALVVERLLAERQGEHYVLRTWIFLGDEETNVASIASEPIVKLANIIGKDDGGPVPEALRRKREELAFDFGKFDYALVDGEVVLFDANKTPTLGALTPDYFMPRILRYADGLAAFAKGAA